MVWRWIWLVCVLLLSRILGQSFLILNSLSGGGNEGMRPSSPSDQIRVLELTRDVLDKSIAYEKEKQNTFKCQAEAEKSTANFLTFGQLLNSALPRMDELSEIRSSVSKAQLRRKPTQVKNWPNFYNELARHLQSISPDMLNSGRLTPMAQHPVGVYTVRLEEDIRAVFSSTVCHSLDQLCQGKLRTSSFSSSGLIAVAGLENPDFVTVRNGEDTHEGGISPVNVARANAEPVNHIERADDSSVNPAGANADPAVPNELNEANAEPVVPNEVNQANEEPVDEGAHVSPTADAGPADSMERPNAELIGSQQIASVYEIKQISLIKDGRDLLKLYNAQKSMICDAIYQITGYHVSYKSKYGFISCYKCTWATYLDEDGVLYISPCFSGDICGPFSTLNLLYFVNCKSLLELNNTGQERWKPPEFLEHLSNSNLKSSPKSTHNVVSASARQGWVETPLGIRKPVTETPQRGRRRGRGRGQGSSREAGQEAGVLKEAGQEAGVLKMRGGYRAKYTFVEVVSNFTDRVTWKAVAEDCNSFVAIKCYKLKEHRDVEVHCYNRLKTLQGSSIPILLDPNFTYKEDDCGRFYGLVVSWVGSKHAGSYKMLPTEALVIARRILVAVHNLGVVHGDIRPLNMNYNFKTKELFLLDFSHSMTDDMMDEHEFQEYCSCDLFYIDMLINRSKTKASRQIQYFHWPDSPLQAAC